jgi:hypothetical protein
MEIEKCCRLGPDLSHYLIFASFLKIIKNQGICMVFPIVLRMFRGKTLQIL